MTEKAERSKNKARPEEEDRVLLLDGAFLDQAVDLDVSAALFVSPADVEGTDTTVLFPFISISAIATSQFEEDAEPRKFAEIVSLGSAASVIGDLAESIRESLERLALMSKGELSPEKKQIQFAVEMLEKAESETAKSLEILRAIPRG